MNRGLEAIGADIGDESLPFGEQQQHGRHRDPWADVRYVRVELGWLNRPAFADPISQKSCKGEEPSRPSNEGK